MSRRFTKEEVKALVIEEFKAMKGDQNFFVGYLFAASDDGCFQLPTDSEWMSWSVEKLRELAADAYVTAALKIMEGQTLPSEYFPLSDKVH